MPYVLFNCLNSYADDSFFGSKSRDEKVYMHVFVYMHYYYYIQMRAGTELIIHKAFVLAIVARSSRAESWHVFSRFYRISGPFLGLEIGTVILKTFS